MRRFISGWITTFATGSVLVLTAAAGQAQTRVADEIRSPYPPDDAAIVGRGPYAAVPPPGAIRGGYQGGYGGYDDAMPPFEVVRIIRSTGYQPLGIPVRRRWVYTISAINPDGYDGRVVLDARTGRIMRFVPAEVSDDEVVVSYGPPGQPPAPPPQYPPSIQRMNARTSLRPPMPVPRVASRTPQATTGKPDLRVVGAAPPPQQPASPQVSSQVSTQVSSQVKAVDTKAADVKPAEKPVEAKPSVQLQPTREMPPVQGLD
jgi:hypothetical protein